MSQRALITGVNGFVGTYLEQELYQAGYEVIGTDLQGRAVTADLLNKETTKNLVNDIAPDYIFHLAGQASVALSWQNPQMTVDVNVIGTLNLLDGVKIADKPIRIVVIGSSDEYGKVKKEDCPISERFEPHPESPYAVSKYMQEKMALLYQTAYGMDVVLTRSFNHTGPGQKKGFVIPDFASQIARIEKGAEPVLRVGNLNARRDFSDVRDIVRGYRLLAETGKCGEIYNIGAGKSYQIAEILRILVSLAKIKIDVIEEPEKMRPIDTPLILADIEKIRRDTGYVPKFRIEDTLKDTLDYWRNN